MNAYERRLQQQVRESCEKEISTRASSTMGSSTHTPSPGPPTQAMLSATILSYVTLDVFTTTPFKGNQLAVVRIPTDLNISKETKQTVAREFNFSETVFLHDLPRNHSRRRLEIFTVNEELPFAGHPVIGAVCHVCQDLEVGADEMTLSCTAGLIQCHYDRKEKMAEVGIPHKVHIHSQTVNGRAVLKAQSYLSRTSIVTSELPVVSIVKGLSFILINLPSVTPHMEKLEAGATGVDASSVKLDEGWGPSFVGCYFYAMASPLNGRNQRLRTRMLEPSIGEDAATGSAACTLACYLALKDGTHGKIYEYSIEQGIEMDRASEIHVRVTLGADGTVHHVDLAGRAVLVTKGSLHLP